MAEVTHRDVEVEHIHDSGGNNGSGFLVGIILLVVVLYLLFYYGLPALRGAASTTPQVNVPGKIDVNVNHK